MVKKVAVLLLTAAAFFPLYWQPVKACSARPLVLADCTGFGPKRMKSATIDYLAANDPDVFNQLVEEQKYGEATCGWLR